MGMSYSASSPHQISDIECFALDELLYFAVKDQRAFAQAIVAAIYIVAIVDL